MVRDVLGIPIAASFPGWTKLKMDAGSRFAIDRTTFPRSVVEKLPIVISFEVEDIHAAVRELAPRGVKFRPSAEKAIFDVGPRLVAKFEDPDGNFVQLNSPARSA